MKLFVHERAQSKWVRNMAKGWEKYYRQQASETASLEISLG